MSQIQVVGLNHRNAPVDLRERISVPASAAAEFIGRLKGGPSVEEALLLSTCNRVEAWLAGDPESAGRHAAELMAERGGLRAEELQKFLYDYRGEDAVAHLFRVASSLDSMVVGETQVLAQVKDAYRVAKELGVTGRNMNMLFQKAFNVAKAVHTQTKIAEGKLSVSSVAVDLAAKVFGQLAERRVLVLGAGETGELTALCFRDRGVKNIVIANRSGDRAAAVAERLGGAATVPLEALEETLPTADILVACASLDKPLVTAAMVGRAMAIRRGRPMFVVDIAVPRNVEPEVDRIPDLYMFNIDDLRSVVERNLAARRARIEEGARIVAEEARAFLAALAKQGAEPRGETKEARP